MKEKQLQKNFVWNMVGIGFYAVTSLIFMIIVTRINGVEDAGIFTFGFSFACMIQMIGMWGGRTYQVTDNTSKTKDCDYVYFRFFNCALMLLVAFIFLLFKDYSPYKNIIIFLLVVYKMIFAFSDMIFGIMQKNNNLFQVGISLTFRSILAVGAFLIVDLLSHNLLYATISLVFADLVVLFFYDCEKLKTYKVVYEKINKNATKLLLIGGLSICAFNFLSYILTNTPKFAIDDIMLESDQAVFGIILMPATLIAICTNFIVQPFIYTLNEYIKKKEFVSFKNTIVKICLFVLLIGSVVLLGTYFFGIPILNLIYGIDLGDYFVPLMLIILGSVFNGLIGVITNALISIRKNKIQLIIYIFSTLFAFVIAYVFVNSCGVLGASLSYVVSNVVLIVSYIFAFIYYYKKLKSNKCEIVY